MKKAVGVANNIFIAMNGLATLVVELIGGILLETLWINEYGNTGEYTNQYTTVLGIYTAIIVLTNAMRWIRCYQLARYELRKEGKV